MYFLVNCQGLKLCIFSDMLDFIPESCSKVSLLFFLILWAFKVHLSPSCWWHHMSLDWHQRYISKVLSIWEKFIWRRCKLWRLQMRWWATDTVGDLTILFLNKRAIYTFNKNSWSSLWCANSGNNIWHFSISLRIIDAFTHLQAHHLYCLLSFL